MDTYGMTPAEIRAHFDKKAAEAIKREEGRQAFLRKLEDPKVRKAARDAAKAIAVLQDFNLEITDWSAIGNEIREVEVEASDGSYEKGWMKF